MNTPFSVFNALECLCSKVVVENMHVLIIQKEAIEIARNCTGRDLVKDAPPAGLSTTFASPLRSFESHPRHSNSILFTHCNISFHFLFFLKKKSVKR